MHYSNETIVHALQDRANEHPHRKAFTLLDASECHESITYAELDRQANIIARDLAEPTKVGDRALLTSAHGLKFIASLFGCLYAKRIAVPAFPFRGSRGFSRLQRIAADSGAKVVIGDSARASLTALWPEMGWLSTNLEDSAGIVTDAPPDPSDVAFLQYTSGSTGDPKGVIVSHANILHNVAAIADAFGQTSESILVCWLPLFHDMGLVGNVLLNVFAGAHCHLLPPARVLQRPCEWLKAISKTGATTSGGPNFIYDLAIKKIPDDELDQLDLRNWRVAYNGAEVVRPNTLDLFAKKFARCGFQANAFRPCYGLAESTLLVSVSSGPQKPVSGRLSCGRPPAETRIAIVDAETTQRRDEGEVGEIWVSSPSVARGYWNQPGEEQTFSATTTWDHERSYLRTGDLGFIRSGELFVVDRLKDLIIVRGRNLYAHDVETTVLRSCKSLSPGFAAAVSIEVAGEERVAVVQEVGKLAPDDLQNAFASVRAAIAEEHETAVSAIAFVRNGLLPRTTSGKVIRRQCGQFLDVAQQGVIGIWREDETSVAAEFSPTEVEPFSVILEWLSQRFHLRPDDVSADEPVVSFGLDSLGAIQLAHHVEQKCRVEVDAASILAGASINQLASSLIARAADEALVQSEPETVAPLSYGQEALYYLQGLDPDTSAYHIAIGLRIRGDLHHDALGAALKKLAASHPALRTTFHQDGDQRFQRVNTSVEVDLSHKDGTCWTQQILDQYLRSASCARFQLEVGPLWRLRVVSLKEREHILLWVTHHLIADLWSLSLLLSELLEIYEGEVSDSPRRPATAGPSFIEYVRREQELIGSERGKQQLAYWLDTLNEQTDRLKLPPWRDLAAARTLEGSSVRLSLDQSLSQKLCDLSARLGTTLAVTLFTAYQILLWRFSGQDSFRTALVYAGRTDGKFAKTAGYFVNLLVIKSAPQPQLSFAEMIGTVQESVTSALRHGAYPYGLLVKELQRGSATRQDLFDAVFVMQASPHELPAAKFALASGVPITIAGLELSPVPIETGASQFDLSLAAAQVDDRIVLELRYNTNIFPDAFAGNMLDCLHSLLEQIANAPRNRVGAARLQREDSELAKTANFEPSANFDSGQTLISLFERQVVLRPEAIAVSHCDTQISYAELNDRANALARRLKDVGVGPESLVILDPERQPDLVLAMVGILKAGAAYVPVDQNWPPERLTWLLANARPTAIVAGNNWVIPECDPEIKIVRTEDARQSSREPFCGPPVFPDQLAYVIYTSGSTGVPKGCLITHRNVVRLFESSQPLFNFNEHDTWSMFHSPAFDLSVWEIWGALLYGGKVVIVPYEITRSPEDFHELLAGENVTVLTQTPSAFRQLAAVAAHAGRRAERLRFVVFGGERLEPRAVEPWTNAYGYDRPQLVNMYGITETTVHVTHRVFTKADAALATRSPIGGPLPDLGIRLLDPEMRLHPEGAAGAIFVAGPGIARGYLRRPELTAERFVPDPYSSVPGARLYASGDLAVVSPDAGLEYLSRADQQVKIRGYRIEPGEVQSVIAEHEAVNDCIVLPYSRDGGATQLVAYFIPREGYEISSRELRVLAASRLPDYMVPSTFIALDQWPLTANGKLDKRALPDPSLHSRSHDAIVAPRTALESELVRIFAEALGVPAVGIEDNYFELGGDSIRSISVRTLAQERGIDFTLRDLNEWPTVAALAQRARPIDTFRPTIHDAKVPLHTGPLPDGVEDAYPLTSVLAGLLFHSIHGDDYESYVTSLHVRCAFSEELLRESIAAVTSRHAILRTTFDIDNFPKPTQLVHEQGIVSLQICEVRNLDPDEQETQLADLFRSLRATRPIWNQLPLARWLVHRRSAESFQLTLNEPFLDGWSVGLLLTEVLAFYRRRLDGDSVDRPPLRAAFRDTVVLEQQAVESSETQQFWREQIEVLPTCDLPRPSSVSHNPELPIARCQMKIEGALLDSINALAARLGVSVKSLLLVAHLKAMAVMSGSDEVVTGLLVNSRPEAADGDRIVGLFTSAVPLRMSLPAGESWTSLISQAHRAEARLLPHRRFPFTELKRFNDGQDLFETVFNFTHFHIYSDLERSSGVEIAGAYASEQTYFDLTAQFHIDRNRTCLVIALDYRVSRFDEETVRQVLAVYDQALRAMTARPDVAHDVRCCAPAEDLEQLSNINQTTRAWEFHNNLCDLVERQVHLTPNAAAVRFMGQTLSFAELNARANQLARVLRREGLKRGDIAAVMLDRSLDLVVVLLAILKSGAAYLPLDREHPRERMRKICGDADARLVITASGESLYSQRRAVSVDDLQRESREQSEHNLDIAIAPDALAYVIYTSGSTGTPKGAMNTHRAICNRLLWMQQQYGLNSDDRVLQKTPYTFDVSVWEFFWPMISGACLVVAEPGGHLDPEYLAETIQKESITTIHFVPAMLRNFLGEASGPWLSLRNVICSGEALDRDLVQTWYGRCDAPLHNLYGPAEAAVDVTSYACDPGDVGIVPIGKPIANTCLYVLDCHLQPVPIAVAGEIFIGGTAVGRGYVNSPDLTASKFIPDPFSVEPGARMYRTGDRGRYRRDGNLEFLGRLDNQVKIRGQRIELEEIEYALRDLEGVSDAVVQLQVAGPPQLIAWVVPDRGRELRSADLRRLLADRLPRYMIPQQFRFTPELPLNANGKVDRRNMLDEESATKDDTIEELLARVEMLDDTEVQRLLATM